MDAIRDSQTDDLATKGAVRILNPRWMLMDGAFCCICSYLVCVLVTHSLMASMRFLSSHRLIQTAFPCCRQLNTQSAENVRGYQQSRHTTNNHPYENMYPWRSLEQFAERLQAGIVYQDEDIVAIDKPWGVGIHKAHPTITRQNSDHMMEAIKFGDPRFCVDDGLLILRDMLKCKDLKVSRSIDRFESGIILLSKNDVGVKVIQRIGNVHKPQGKLFAKFWCLTKGYPVIPGNFIAEKITLMKADADEFAERKEPILVKKSAFSKIFVRYNPQEFITGAVEMRVLEANKEYAVSLVEIGTNQNKFSLIRCYAASKTSFILGDGRFAKRVRHVLGKPITLNPQAVPDAYYEPLPFTVRKRLLVPKNSAIPLMVHLRSIIVPKFGKRKEVVISASKLPEHFDWTMYRLFLNHQEPPEKSTGEVAERKYFNL